MGRYPHLFSPIRIGKVTFKNRIGMAPQSIPDEAAGGHLSPRGMAYFEARARGGAGIVTVGETPVDFEYAAKDPGFLRLGYDRMNAHDMAELKVLTDAIKRHGAVASIELSHCGELNPPFCLGGKNPIGPSAFVREDGQQVDAMDEAMMDRVAENFARSAAYCRRVGFDMCMIHGGHGWLLAEYLSPLSNKRTDAYGGSLQGRARFPIMVLDRIRAAVGRDFLLEYRLSGDEVIEGGIHIDEIVEFCRMIEDRVDIIHVSVGTPYDENCQSFSSIYTVHGHNAHLAEAVKKAVRIPVAAIGGINTPELGEQLIAEGKADFVYMGRQMVADPEFADKSLTGRSDEIAPCVRCMCCHAAPPPPTYLECTVNPRATREYYLNDPPAEPQKVMVIGGGPAGMVAAATAAARGHEVTLYEKTDSLGGLLKFADKDLYKGDIKSYKDHLISMLRKRGVTIKLNTEVTPQLIETEEPYAVVVAVGSRRLVPDIPGIDRAVHVLDAYDVTVGSKVVIIGGGLAGCEAGLHFAGLGSDVTVIEMSDQLAPDGYPYHRHWLLAKLFREVKVRTGLTCTEISHGGVKTVDREGKEELFPADTVIYAVGMLANTEAADAFCMAAPVKWFVVGDCVRPAKVKEAVHEGYFAAMDI